MAKKKNLFDTVVDNVKNLFTPKQVAPKVTTPAKTAVKTTPSTVQQPRAISAVNVKLPDLKKQNVYTNTINRATNPTVKTVPTTTTRAATPVSTTVRTNTTRRTVSLPAVRTAADTRTYNRFGGNVVSPSAIQQTMNSRGYYARKVVAPVRNTLTTKENVAKSNVYGSTKKLGFSFDNSKVNKWLKTGYKMTSKDSKEAKKMYAEYSKFVNSQGEDYYKRSTSDGTAEHALDTAMRQVLLKTNGILGSMMAGTASSNNLTTKAADAAVSKANEKAGISSDYNNPYSSAMNTAQENHPIAYTAGNAIGKMGQYALFNDVAGDLGVSQALQSQLAKRIPQKAAEVASNLIVGQAADTALDTVPTVVENNLNGKYKNDPNQMAKDILANQATNLAYNIAGEGLGAVNNAIGKKLLDINTQKAAQAAQNDQFIKKLSDIANTQDTSIPQTPNNLYDLARKVNATAPVTSIPDVATDTVKTSNIPDLVTGATKSTSSATFDPSQSSGLRFYDTKLGKYVTEDGKTIPDIKPGEKVSDVFSNTATTDKVLSQDVAEGTLDPNDFKYDVHNQGNAVTRAQERVANNADQLYDDYMSGEARKIRDNGVYDDEDSANMMELSRHYSTEARNSTDEMSRAQNSVKSKRILMELRKNSTKSGQFNSILQQYANTADNLALKGNGIVADKAETWVKNNPAVSNDISKLSSQIENVLNKHNASEVFANGSQADVEALRSKLTDEIQAIIKKHDPSTRKALKGLSEDAISEILNSKQADDIASTLDFFASSRSTGVKESTMQTVEDLMTEAQKYGENSKQRVQLEGQAYAAIANDIGRKGGTFKDKFDSLRYLNMLCSPKTHAKNVANNIIFSDAIMGTKDNLAAVIEAGVDRVNKAFGGAGIDRTKSVLNPFSETDRSLISSCYKDASDSAYRQLDNGNKYYDVGSSIEQAIPAFSNENWLGKFINNWSNFNTKALDTEDQMTMIQKYTTSLAGYLKANGKDVSILNSSADADKQFMEGARKYAISQAEEAAFHQTGMFGSAAAKFGKFNNELESSALENGEPNAASRALGYAGNIVVPFKKTPANILATALSYSPANALRTVIFDTANLKAKRITAAKYIDEMAKSATGSSLVLLGGILAHEGIVGIDYLDDKTQSKLNSTTGNSGAVLHVGPYNISLGDFSPEAIPLIEGAVAYESKRRNGISGNTALNMFFSGLSATSDAITDTTMLSGISDVLQSIKYSDGSSDMWTRLGTSVAGNLAGQFIPSVVNVGEKTGDANKRSTYTGKSGIEGTIGSEAKYLQSRIPILGNKLEPAVDVWGNETNNFGGNAAGRLAYTGFTPATLTNNTADSVDKEISRLFLATNNKDVNPQMAQSEAKFNTEDGFKQLTPQEWTQYQKQKGTLQHQLVTDFMNTDAYKTMNDNDRADVIGKLFGYAKTSTQVKFGSKSTSAKKLDEAYAQNGSQGVIDSIIGSSQKKTEKSENDAAISELMGNNINADNLTADDLNKLNNGKGLSAKSSTGETSTGTSSASAETTATGDTSKANQYRLADLKKQMTDKETKQVLEDLKTGKVTSDTIGGLNISENAKVSAYKRAFDIEGDNNGSLKLDEVRNGIKNIKGMSDADKEKLYSEIKPDAKTDLNGNKIAEGKTASEAYGGTSNTQSTKIPDLARNATTFEKSYSGTGDPSDINTALSSSKMSRAEKDKAYSKLLDLSSLGKQESAGYGVAKSNGVSTSEYFEAREGANALAKKNTGKNNGLVSKLEANNYLASRKDLSDAEKEKLFYALVPNAKGGYTGKSTGNAAIGTVSSGSGTSSRRSSRRSSYSAPAASSSATAVQNPASVAQTAVSTPTAGTTAASAGSSASTIPGYTPGTKYNSPNITKRSTVVTLADGSTLTKEEYNSYLAKIKYRNEYATEINKILEKKGAKTGYQQLTPLPSDSQTGKKSYSSNATAASLGIGQEPSMSAVASTNGTTTSVSQTAPYISPYANDGSGIVTLSDGSKISKNEYSLYLERIKSYNSIAKKQNALLAKSNVTSGYQRLLDLPTMMQTGSKQYMSTASASMFGLAPAQTTTATSTPDINSFVQAAQTNGLDIAQLSNLASRIGDMSDAEARNYINFRTDLTPEQKNMWYKILLKPSDQSSYLVQNMLKYYYQINAKQNTSAQNMV